jgi:predicted dinucleotide-binding enzyme
VAEAAAFGDVVALVVPYPAIEEIGRMHAGALAGKVLVLDVANPIARRDGEDVVKRVADQGGPGLVTAKWVPGARIVRAFNAIGAGRLSTISHRAGDPVGVPIAGDDPQAITVAERLIRGIGFEPVLVGGLAMGKHLVPGTPLAGERSAAEIRQIAATLR